MTQNFDFNMIAQRALKNIRALARGNGAETDAIQIKEIHDSFIKCEAITHLELHPNIDQKQKEGRIQAGELLKDAATLEKTIQEQSTKAIKNDEIRKLMARMLLERADKGFSLHSEHFDMPALKKVYSVQQNCGDCQGHAQKACGRCNGQRMEVCNVCHARGMIACNRCHGSGTQQNQNGQQTPCSFCHGARQVTCPTCQKRGQITCRQCKGTGTTKCNTCKGQGAFTIINEVNFTMKTLFEIDRAELPHPAVKAIETRGSKMVERDHIKVSGEQVKREDGGLAIQYQVEFPYANLLLSLNGQPIKAELFGFKGKIVKLPAFLENMVGSQVALLEQAARGQNAEPNIVKASKTRIISEALALVLQNPRKAALFKLKKRYPLGISNDGLKNIITNAHAGLKQLTSKSRYGAYAIASLFNLALTMGYFLSLRAMITPSLNGNMMMVADLALIPLGGFIGYMITKFIIRRPLIKALGHIVKNPKLREVGAWQNYALSAGIFILTLIILFFTGQALPSWLPL